MCRHLRNPDAQDFEFLWKRDCILVTLFPLIPDSAHAHPNKEDQHNTSVQFLIVMIT